MQLWEVATWGAFEWGHLHLGLFCLLCFASRSRDPTNAVEFAQVQAHCKGLNWFNNCGGVPLAQKSLWTNSQACFIQSEEKVNTLIKGPSKTWISHSNATKCRRYNYAKCIFLFFQHPICVATSSTYVKELFWITKGSVSLFIETLTEHGASRDRFPVQPEGDLRQNDGHDAREVGLNHEIANFPFQMEICCHHNIFACSGRRETERETLGVRARRAEDIQGKKRSISTSNSLKTPLEVVAGHQNKWRVGSCWSGHTSHAWEHSKVIVTIDNLTIKKKQQIVTVPSLVLPLSDAACSFMTLDSGNFPSAPALLCHVHNLCSKDMRKTFCHSPRCFFAGKIQTGAEMAPILVFPQL